MKTIWTEEDMIRSCAEDMDFEPDRCEVIASRDREDEPCLIVLETTTGRTSDEAGDAGRWHPDGTAYGD